MAVIRSPAAGLPAASGVPPRPAHPARTAAQRAFFEAALGNAQAPAAPQQAIAQTAAPAPASANTDAPQRYLRPGSLIDIKV